MRVQLLIATMVAGCAGSPAPPQRVALGPPQAEVRLRELAGADVRRGELVVHADALQLNIRRGARSAPFLRVERSIYQLGCYAKATTERDRSARDVWWIFSDGEHAVALQMTTYDVGVWYWDTDRDCAIRVPALHGITVADGTPSRYYKADDAQVAYRWNQSSTPRSTLRRFEPSPDDGHQGVETSDFLPDVAGAERLIVEPDIIAIRAADGRTLMQEQFEIDPDWPCYNAQLSVFDDPTGGFYAVASFDTFGTFTDCEAPQGDSRYTSVIADWNPERGRFVTSFRVREQLRPLHPNGEDSVIEVERSYPVAGGSLRLKRRVAARYGHGTQASCVDFDHATGTCLQPTDCWHWSSSNERTAEFVLVGADGVEIDLGTARAGVRERGEEC